MAKHSDIRDHLNNIGEEASEIFQEVAGDLQGSAKKVQQQVKQQFNEYSTDARDYVKENPVTAVAIALGVGFLMGVLFRK